MVLYIIKAFLFLSSKRWPFPVEGGEKIGNFTKNICRSHKRFCLPAISQPLVDVISVDIACKELKIAQVAHVFQPFSFGLSVG